MRWKNAVNPAAVVQGSESSGRDQSPLLRKQKKMEREGRATGIQSKNGGSSERGKPAPNTSSHGLQSSLGPITAMARLPGEILGQWQSTRRVLRRS